MSTQMAAPESLQSQRRRARTAPAAVDFIHGGGWRAVSPRGGERGGLTAHRGVLHPDEWVDWEQVTTMIEAELGYTIAELRSVYRQGPLSAMQRELRSRIDARLLALSRAGGNMALFGRLLGFYVHNGSCKVIADALARARRAGLLAAHGPIAERSVVPSGAIAGILDGKVSS